VIARSGGDGRIALMTVLGADGCGTSERMIFDHYRRWMPGLDRGHGRRIAGLLRGGSVREVSAGDARDEESRVISRLGKWRRGESNPVRPLLHDADDDGSRQLFRGVSVVRVPTRRAPRQDFGRMVLPYLTVDIARGSILGPGVGRTAEGACPGDRVGPNSPVQA
jgi:hypothetical protein